MNEASLESIDQEVEGTQKCLSPEDRERLHSEGKRIIEALLFSTNEPLTLKRIGNVLDTHHSYLKTQVKQLLEELKNEYENHNHSFRLCEIAKGFILRTCEEMSPYVHLLLKTSRPERLSQAATEVLAIIAYKQPITRPQIDEIRGVDSSGIISMLVERQLIESVGKLEVPGRPSLYSVTHSFLRYFGLKDLTELPNLHN